MSDLVQINNNAALAQSASSSWGDEEGFSRPRYIRMKQPSSTAADLENFKNGQFVDAEIGKGWTSIELVLMSVRYTRKYQSPYEPGTKRELYCRSANRKVPVTTDDRFEAKAADCASCAFGNLAWARWKQTKASEDVPKNACEMEVELFFVEVGNPEQGYYYIANGKSREPAETMYERLGKISKAASAGGKRRPELYEYAVTMSSERMKDGKYCIKFPQVRELTDEEITAMGDAFQQHIVARNAAFEAARNAATVQERLSSDGSETKVIERPAAPVSKPEILVPAASKRGAGAKPVYVAPVIDAAAEENDPDAPKATI